jgi:hypothetical protein
MRGFFDSLLGLKVAKGRFFGKVGTLLDAESTKLAAISAQQTAKCIKKGRLNFPPPGVAWLKILWKMWQTGTRYTRNSTLATSSSTAYRLLRSAEKELEGNYAVWNCLNSAWRN